MIKDFETLKEKAKALRNTRLANIHRANNGSCSMNMINCKNGKRISFSKMLSIKLDLQDSVDIVELEDEGMILISKNLPYDFKSTYSLRGDDRKIIYSSELVEVLTEIFNLDFGTKVSRSFTDITINTDDNTVIAAITLVKK